MSEYETILEETLESFYENAETKEDHDQIVAACKSILQHAKEKRQEFIDEHDEEEEEDDDDDDDLDDDEDEESDDFNDD